MKRKSFFNLFFPILSLVLFFLIEGCSPGMMMINKDGTYAFNMKQYALAIEMLQKEMEKTKYEQVKAEKAFMIAESYRLTNHPQEATDWYKFAMDLHYYDPVAIYYLALMLKEQGMYKESSIEFLRFAVESPENADVVKREIDILKMVLQWKKVNTNVVVFPMDTFNSVSSDYAPTLFENKAMVFSSDRSGAKGDELYRWTGEKYSDLFVSPIDSNTKDYGTPVPFSPIINSINNEGTVTFSKDFTEMYFTRCFFRCNACPDYCQIYYSRKIDALEGKSKGLEVGFGPSSLENKTWSEPEMLQFFSDSCNVGHPRLAPNDSMLFFSSDFKGGYGGKDLYVCYLTANGWSRAINLGPEINTEGDEMFPYLNTDGKLYFSSNGHPTMGGLDNFVATKTDEGWGNVQVLPIPINSHDDDFAMIFDGEETYNDNGYLETMGYFSSARPGKGKDDIYEFQIRRPVEIVLDGIVLEKVFEDPNNPNSTVIGYKTVPFADVTLQKRDTSLVDLAKVKADGRAEFHFKLSPKTDYKVLAGSLGFFTRYELVTTKGIKGVKDTRVVLKVQIILDRIYKGMEITIPNIYYNFDKWDIREDASPILDTLALLLDINQGITKVELGSHTDARGSDSYNMKLSQNRAQSVVNYLISKGISSDRLEAKGYGETKLLNRCNNNHIKDCSEEEHQRNRRTTFKVISATSVLESVEPQNIEVDPAMVEREEQQGKPIPKFDKENTVTTNDYSTWSLDELNKRLQETLSKNELDKSTKLIDEINLRNAINKGELNPESADSVRQLLQKESGEQKPPVKKSADLKYQTMDELNNLLQEALKKNELDRASSIMDEINSRQQIPPVKKSGDLHDQTMEELNNLLQEALKKNELDRASSIMDEINSRQKIPPVKQTEDLQKMSLEELNNLLIEALKKNDLNKATAIMNQINSRDQNSPVKIIQSDSTKYQNIKQEKKETPKKEIKPEIKSKISLSNLPSATLDELNIMLQNALEKNDFDNATKILDEINSRGQSAPAGNKRSLEPEQDKKKEQTLPKTKTDKSSLSKYSTAELNTMLDNALKANDYDKATKILDELHRRGQ